MRRPQPRPYRPAPGDENRPWKTYSQIWAEHRITRGAIDKLVMQEALPTISGLVLAYFKLKVVDEFGSRPDVDDAARRLGWDTKGDRFAHVRMVARECGIDIDQTYYDVEKVLADTAALQLLKGSLSIEMIEALYANRDIANVSAEQLELIKKLEEGNQLELGTTTLYSDLVTCERCGAEVQRDEVENQRTCPVCDK